MNKHIWIGGNDIETEGTWFWTTSGREIDEFHWSYGHHGQPNNLNGNQDCIAISGDRNHGGLWNDLSCDSSYYFICEFYY